MMTWTVSCEHAAVLPVDEVALLCEKHIRRVHSQFHLQTKWLRSSGWTDVRDRLFMCQNYKQWCHRVYRFLIWSQWVSCENDGSQVSLWLLLSLIPSVISRSWKKHFIITGRQNSFSCDNGMIYQVSSHHVIERSVRIMITQIWPSGSLPAASLKCDRL